jgi:hypothetical protein
VAAVAVLDGGCGEGAQRGGGAGRCAAVNVRGGLAGCGRVGLQEEGADARHLRRGVWIGAWWGNVDEGGM